MINYSVMWFAITIFGFILTNDPWSFAILPTAGVAFHFICRKIIGREKWREFNRSWDSDEWSG